MTPMDSKTLFKVELGALGAIFAGMNSVATQFAAERLHYQSILGAPLFGQFYAPWSWWFWKNDYLYLAPKTFAIIQTGLVAGSGLLLMAYVSAKLSHANQAKGVEGLHGSAHFASEEEIRQTGLIPKAGEKGTGVFVGGWTDPAGTLHYLRHYGPEHIAAIAPTRSGKGIGLVIPTLTTWPHSVVVNDIKAELWNLTAGYRKKYAKNKVLKFDPGSPKGSCCFNPLEEVRMGTDYEIADVQNIVDMVVDPDGKGMDGADGHWKRTGHAFLTGVILHLKNLAQKRNAEKPDKEPEIVNLAEVAWALSNPKRPIDELYAEMVSNEHRPTIQAVVATAGRDMENRPPQERGSVLSTATSYLMLYRDPIVAENTSRSDFQVQDLMNHESPVSLYLVVSPGDLSRLKPLMRLVLNQIIRGLTGTGIEFEKGIPKKPHNHRLLLMLDEFTSFGKMEIIHKALSYMAGYGIKAYLIMQDISQLKSTYGKDESILANCHIRVIYTPNTLETAEWVSKMLGQTTILKKQTTTSHKTGSSHKSINRSVVEVGRPLMTPTEVMQLKASKEEDGKVVEPGELLVFTAGNAPIKGTRLLYFRTEYFRKATEIDPPVALAQPISVPKRKTSLTAPVSKLQAGQKSPEEESIPAPVQTIPIEPGKDEEELIRQC